MQSSFDPVSMIMTSLSRRRSVSSVTIRRRGTEPFSIGAGDAGSGDGGPAPPPGQPFSLRDQRIDGEATLATLCFSTEQAATWHETFRARRVVKLDMKLSGGDSEYLYVYLDCQELNAPPSLSPILGPSTRVARAVVATVLKVDRALKLLVANASRAQTDDCFHQDRKLGV
jgi:hypothetical protein